MRSASHYVSGLYTPRPDDTPRTRQQKEVRRKRVEYFETLSQTHIPSAKKESDREAGNTKLEQRSISAEKKKESKPIDSTRQSTNNFNEQSLRYDHVDCDIANADCLKNKKTTPQCFEVPIQSNELGKNSVIKKGESKNLLEQSGCISEKKLTSDNNAHPLEEHAPGHKNTDVCTFDKNLNLFWHKSDAGNCNGNLLFNSQFEELESDIQCSLHENLYLNKAPQMTRDQSVHLSSESLMTCKTGKDTTSSKDNVSHVCNSFKERDLYKSVCIDSQMIQSVDVIKGSAKSVSSNCPDLKTSVDESSSAIMNVSESLQKVNLYGSMNTDLKTLQNNASKFMATPLTPFVSTSSAQLASSITKTMQADQIKEKSSQNATSTPSDIRHEVSPQFLQGVLGEERSRRLLELLWESDTATECSRKPNMCKSASQALSCVAKSSFYNNDDSDVESVEHEGYFWPKNSQTISKERDSVNDDHQSNYNQHPSLFSIRETQNVRMNAGQSHLPHALQIHNTGSCVGQVNSSNHVFKKLSAETTDTNLKDNHGDKIKKVTCAYAAEEIYAAANRLTAEKSSEGKNGVFYNSIECIESRTGDDSSKNIAENTKHKQLISGDVSLNCEDNKQRKQFNDTKNTIYPDEFSAQQRSQPVIADNLFDPDDDTVSESVRRYFSSLHDVANPNDFLPVPEPCIENTPRLSEGFTIAGVSITATNNKSAYHDKQEVRNKKFKTVECSQSKEVVAKASLQQCDESMNNVGYDNRANISLGNRADIVEAWADKQAWQAKMDASEKQVDTKRKKLAKTSQNELLASKKYSKVSPRTNRINNNGILNSKASYANGNNAGQKSSNSSICNIESKNPMQNQQSLAYSADVEKSQTIANGLFTIDVKSSTDSNNFLWNNNLRRRPPTPDAIREMKFEYDQKCFPANRLPKSLRNELRIDLSGSIDGRAEQKSTRKLSGDSIYFNIPVQDSESFDVLQSANHLPENSDGGSSSDQNHTAAESKMPVNRSSEMKNNNIDEQNPKNLLVKSQYSETANEKQYRQNGKLALLNNKEFNCLVGQYAFRNSLESLDSNDGEVNVNENEDNVPVLIDQSYQHHINKIMNETVGNEPNYNHCITDSQARLSKSGPGNNGLSQQSLVTNRCFEENTSGIADEVMQKVNHKMQTENGEPLCKTHDKLIKNKKFCHENQINNSNEKQLTADTDGVNQSTDNYEIEDCNEESVDEEDISDSKWLRPKQSNKEPRATSAPVSNVVKTKSVGESQQRVKSSLESNENYQRKWKSSSVLWTSYKTGQLGKPSIAEVRRSLQQSLKSSKDADERSVKKLRYLKNSMSLAGSRQLQRVQNSTEMSLAAIADDDDEIQTNRADGSIDGATGKSKRSPADCYTAYLQQVSETPRDKLCRLLLLPDEILLHIFSYSNQRDLGRLGRTCKRLQRIICDLSLWDKIIVRKRDDVTDKMLSSIGAKHPSSLTLQQCSGSVTSGGLRDLFRQCADCLVELSIQGCATGHLCGDTILLHAARCRYLTHINANWSSLTDNGLMAIVESCERLDTVTLHGCTGITDESVVVLASKHGASLKTLELFGCFSLMGLTAQAIASYCQNLVTLNMGQCWKLLDGDVRSMVRPLTLLENLDLRNCTQMEDGTVQQIVKCSPKLHTLCLSGCTQLTDLSLGEIAANTSKIRSLDISGCEKMTDVGVKFLVTTCNQLEMIDLSSTAITHKSVSAIASQCNKVLRTLRLNNCKHVTLESLVRLAKSCHRLSRLFIYDLNGIKSVNEIKKANPRLIIERN